MSQMRLFIIGILVLLQGCDIGQEKDEASTTSILTKTSFGEGGMLTKSEFARLKLIPEKADNRIDEEYRKFVERSKIVDYILANKLKGELEIQLELREIINNYILTNYINQSLPEVTDEDLLEYYNSHIGEFQIPIYIVDIYVQRTSPVRVEKEQEEILMEVDRLREAIFSSTDEASINVAGFELTEKSKAIDSKKTDHKVLLALEGVKEGQISKPIFGEASVTVIHLRSIDFSDSSFVEVREKVLHQLRQELKLQELKKLTAVALSRN